MPEDDTDMGFTATVSSVSESKLMLTGVAWQINGRVQAHEDLVLDMSGPSFLELAVLGS